MDKLEHYLDQVCRSIGGPKPLRQHVRQELREHLLDAAAEHKAAGMSEADALDRALEDFGGPELVRSELEATHGHRLLPVVIDKAMQWQEMTMRAKWLWTTWAYLAVAGVVVMELLFVWFTANFMIPKMQKIRADGWLGFQNDAPFVESAFSFLLGLVWAWRRIVLWLLMVATGWGLFEWRVRSENKPFMRLAALGSVALGLTVVIVMAGAMMVISFELGFPAMVQLSRPYTAEQMATIDTSVAAVAPALAKQDWAAVDLNVKRAAEALNRLEAVAGAIQAPDRTTRSGVAVREQLEIARGHLQEAEQAAREKDGSSVEAALRKFSDSYDPLVRAPDKPGR